MWLLLKVLMNEKKDKTQKDIKKNKVDKINMCYTHLRNFLSTLAIVYTE